ncbi:MAG: pentapeptide repeat-containing protein, partial [Spirosomaceae bacterium]|nr:pentapeptide repeat-containing protein [Spirosomataceae bacterium]
MKKLLFTPLLFLSLAVFAQKNISAEEIFRMIDSGEEVTMSDAVITGTLDLTELSNKEKVNGKSDYAEYKSYVKAPLTFKNCVFKDDVIAYKNLQDGKDYKSKNVTVTWNGKSETHTANFEEAVVFENCVFEGASEFKYSKFNEAVNFEGTMFSEEANFKYAKFKELVGFGNCSFDSEANFKYAEFSQDADFFKNRFNDYANFKYAIFGRRVTFKNSSFGDYAVFKYTQIDKEAVFT